MKLGLCATQKVTSPATNVRVEHAVSREHIISKFVSPMISCGVWQVKGDAGHLAEVEFFVGFEEVIEGCLDFIFWGSVSVCVVGLDDFGEFVIVQAYQ